VKRRWTTIVVVSVTAITLVVGSIGVFAAQENYGNQFKGVTLRWIVTPQSVTDAIMNMLPAFQKKTGIKVIPDMMDEERLAVKLITENAAGIYSYDIIPIRDSDGLNYIDRGIIQPLDPYIDAPYLPVPMNVEGFPPAFFEALCVREGKTWGIPLGAGTISLGYRKDWFDQAGFTEPITWSDVIAAAKYFTKGGQYGISVRGAKGHHACCTWYMTTLHLWWKTF